MQTTPNSIYEKLVTLGNDWADKNAIAELAEENKKTLLAQLARDSGETSMAARESSALGSKEYISHVAGMVEARREANRAKVAYDSAKVWFEAWRTVEANERAANRGAV